MKLFPIKDVKEEVYLDKNLYAAIFCNEKKILKTVHNLQEEGHFTSFKDFECYIDEILVNLYWGHKGKNTQVYLPPIYFTFIKKKDFEFHDKWGQLSRNKNKYKKHLEDFRYVKNLSDIEDLKKLYVPDRVKDLYTKEFKGYMDEPVTGSIIKLKKDKNIYEVKKTAYSNFVGWYQYDFFHPECKELGGTFSFQLSPKYIAFIREHKRQKILTGVEYKDFRLLKR